MYAQLGNIVFDGLKGFTNYNRKHAATLAKHPLVDRKAKIQMTGEELEELAIEMMFHKNFCTPETEVKNLRTAMSAGTVMPLVLGTGELVGNFVIQDINEGVKHSGPTGVTVMSNVTVSLLEYYDDDELASQQSKAKNEAFANQSNQPLKIKPLQPTFGNGLASVKSMQKAGYAQSAGASSLNKASNPATRVNELRKAKDSFNEVNTSMQDFQNDVGKVEGALDNYDDIVAAAEMVKTQATNTVNAINNDDLPGALAASGNTLSSINTLSNTSANLVALTVARRI